jgi:predicted DNA-binding protein (MmcQ/YjbR family)
MAASPTKPKTRDSILDKRTFAIKALIEAKPGATAHPNTVPGAIIYKVKGKMFAILSFRHFSGVIVKCEPELVDILRQRYAGIGRRGHLDPRFWISVSLDTDTDVPAREVKRLVALSYDLVCAKLTRKQKAELQALAPPTR